MPPEREGRAHPKPEPGAARDLLGASRLATRLRAHPVIRLLIPLFPPAAGLAVGKALLDYLPQPLSQDAARYLVAALGALTITSTLGWLRRWLDDRSSRAGTNGGDAGVTPLLPGIQSPSTNDLFDASREALLNAVVADASGDDELIGWTHFYHEAGERGRRPTAIGTCYGLKSMLLLGGTDPRFRQHRVVETLWQLQVPEGGWSARTQSTVGRPRSRHGSSRPCYRRAGTRNGSPMPSSAALRCSTRRPTRSGGSGRLWLRPRFRCWGAWPLPRRSRRGCGTCCCPGWSAIPSTGSGAGANGS